ncbi:hypothetical protein BC628DRAFT_1332676 [Trametes gibbosa]|nr:hypothetical protein BC628DRAFT_1332676 [Trametes gibbosa]
MDRSPTPGRTHIAAPGTAALRPRTPSSASLRPSGLNPNGARQPVQSNPAPYAPPPAMHQRAGTNASVGAPFDQGPDITYSTEARSRTAANDAVRMRAPSAASMRPLMDQQRPPYMSGAPPPARTPTPHIEPDTKSGGEAGMAGVGRRGFAAAARAAMFTSTLGPPPPLFQGPGGMAPMTPGQGMDGRRANAPRFLDIASATNYAAANTPPLSPGSGTASMSPHSPYSQHSPILAGLPSPNITPTAPAGSGIASSPTSPVSDQSLRERVLPPSQEAPKVTLPDAPSTPRLPFFEKFKNKLPAVDTSTPSPQAGSGSADPSPLSPQSDDGSYDGLAYANSDEEEDEEDVPLRASPLPLATPTKPAGAAGGGNRVRFPSMTNSESKYSSASSSSSSTTSPRMPQRKLSTSTVGSSYSSRTISKSTGALDRAMETLFEDLPTSPTTSTSSARPLVSPGAPTADTHRDSVPKPPTRSHTSPTLPSSARAEAQKSASRRPRRRVCLRCEKHIEDGRWIQVEGGNVLCDKCWKNMYLPKVSARLCLGTGTRTWTQTRARTRCRCRSADGVHTRARAKGSKIAPSISVSYANLEGIYMSCEGIYTSRECMLLLRVYI